MPHPGAGFPTPPFAWPHVGRQWPTHNVESDQANGLVMWLPYGGAYPGVHRHVDTIGGLVFTEGSTPTWVFDNERGWSLLFDDATNERLTTNTAAVLTYPFTMSCQAWWDDISITAPLFAMFVGDKDADNEYHHLGMHGGNAVDAAMASSRSTAAGSKIAYTSTGLTVNTWHHLCGIYSASNSRAVLIDGHSKGTNSIDASPSGLDSTVIGKRGGTGSSQYPWSGRISDVRIYNVAKSDADVYQMAVESWELYQIPPRLWRLGAITPPPPTAALPIFPPPDGIHSLVFGGVTVR